MPGRHTAPDAVGSRQRAGVGKWIAAAVVLVVVIGLGVFAFDKVFGGCGELKQFTVAADPSIAPVISKVVDDTSAEDLGCANLKVQATPSATVAAALAKPEGTPALWIPDSTLWTVKASKSTGALLDMASQSLASTPAVIVTKRGDTPFFDTWLSVLRLKGLRIGDPLTDSVADAPVLGALAEAEQGKGDQNAITAALVPIAQAQMTNKQQQNADERLGEVTRQGGVAVSTEQQMLEYNARNSGANLTGTVPQTGSFVLNYPMVVTEPPGPSHDSAKESGIALAAALASGNGKKALSDSGFRGPDAAPLSGDRGIGQVAPLAVTDQGAVDNTLRRYAVLAQPSRILAVVDVSGSMNAPAGGSTRLALTSQALETGIRLFPDNAEVGMWAFSINQGANGQDWRELLPIRGLGEPAAGGTQRDALIGQTRGLAKFVGGGTGLYDTALAAFRKVKEEYEPGYVNSVVLVTDGTNEKPGSMSLTELLDTLEKEQDPAKPVIIVTLGITDDADASVLQQISAATGGTSRVTRSPADIPNIVVDSIRARTGG